MNPCSACAVWAACVAVAAAALAMDHRLLSRRPSGAGSFASVSELRPIAQVRRALVGTARAAVGCAEGRKSRDAAAAPMAGPVGPLVAPPAWGASAAGGWPAGGA